jgi:23S rRNA (guanosine2251-2'-O)-methyltransferase
LGGEQVEGRRAVLELLRAGRRRARDVWIADGPDTTGARREIEERAREAHVRVVRVSREALNAEARTGSPQGVLAHAASLWEADFGALCRDHPTPFLLGLDGVTDPQNLGALLRTAEGAGVTGVVLPRHRAAHVTPAVTKAAAGAVEHLPIAVVPGLPAALARARDHGLWVVGLDPAGDGSVFDLGLAPEPLLVVLGSEGSGLSRLTRQRCDVLARIPLHGRLASLNVAAAGAIVLFEISRHRQGHDRPVPDLTASSPRGTRGRPRRDGRGAAGGRRS